MKKSMAIALGALMAMSVASTAMANEEFKFDGDVRVRYQKDSNKDDKMITRVRLNGEYKLDNEFSVYARVAGNVQRGGEHGAGSVLDRWGVKYNSKDVSVTAGRQGLFVGQGSLSTMAYYDNERSKLQVDAVKAKFNLSEKTSVTATVGKFSDTAEDDLTVGQVDHKVNDKLSVGGAYLKVEKFKSSSAYATYDFTKDLQGYVEFVKSNADKNDTAFNFGLGYTIDKKNFVAVNYFGQDVKSLTYAANWPAPLVGSANNVAKVKAVEVFYNYAYDKNLDFQIHNYNEKGDTRENRFRAQVVYKF